MTVPNIFTHRPNERDEALRAFSLVLALAGVGVAAGFATLPGAIVTVPPAGIIALVAAALSGLALAVRIWILPGWATTHGVHATVAGLAWGSLGFLLPAAIGVVPIVMGAALVGAGLAGFASMTGRVAARRGV